jgi:hypothetical protein
MPSCGMLPVTQMTWPSSSIQSMTCKRAQQVSGRSGQHTSTHLMHAPYAAPVLQDNLLPAAAPCSC